jgi:positive regulator of sigma E activity
MIEPVVGLDLHDTNLWLSSTVLLYLCILVTLYMIKWRHQKIPIMQILTILLVNEILYSAF